jgi:hypothetical protein
MHFNNDKIITIRPSTFQLFWLSIKLIKFKKLTTESPSLSVSILNASSDFAPCSNVGMDLCPEFLLCTSSQRTSLVLFCHLHDPPIPGEWDISREKTKGIYGHSAKMINSSPKPSTVCWLHRVIKCVLTVFIVWASPEDPEYRKMNKESNTFIQKDIEFGKISHSKML